MYGVGKVSNKLLNYLSSGGPIYNNFQKLVLGEHFFLLFKIAFAHIFSFGIIYETNTNKTFTNVQT